MKKLGIAFALLLLLFGCSAKENDNTLNRANAKEESNTQNATALEGKLEEAKKENGFLKEKISNVSADIQVLDHKSRRIMGLIKDDKLEELKMEYDIDFEISDEGMFMFEGHEVSLFFTDMAPLPMYFEYYNPRPDGVEIGYTVFGGAEGEEFKSTISFVYDADYNLEFISSGG